MVQILPYVQSPLEQLTPYLSQAGAQIGEGFKQRQARKRLEAIFPQQSNAPGQISGDQQRVDSQQSAMSNPSLRVNASNAADIYRAYADVHGEKAADAALDQILRSQKEAADIHTEQRKEQALERKQIAEKQEKQGNIQKTFNVASSLLAKNTPGVGISPGAATGLSRKAVEGRSTFNTLKGKFESILLPMVNKGTLAKERFNFILSQIPDAADSQRAIAGKLRGLAETLSEDGFPIDTKILDTIPWVSEELKGLGEQEEAQEIEAGSELTEDIARKLLQQAGNDKEKARQLAKKLGYEF